MEVFQKLIPAFDSICEQMKWFDHKKEQAMDLELSEEDPNEQPLKTKGYGQRG